MSIQGFIEVLVTRLQCLCMDAYSYSSSLDWSPQNDW